MFTASPRFVPLALVAAVAAAFLQTAAFAQTSQVPARTIEVRPGGLDLATEEGRAQLDQRIAIAARRVCAPGDVRDVQAIANRARCQKLAVASAADQRAVLVARAETRVQQAALRGRDIAVN